MRKTPSPGSQIAFESSLGSAFEPTPAFARADSTSEHRDRFARVAIAGQSTCIADGTRGPWAADPRSQDRPLVGRPLPSRVDGARRRQDRHQTPTQKDLSQRPARGTEPTANDASAPAESVRVTDVPACGRGRAYLVERELEQDGYEALKALVSDYLNQAELLEDVPMAVSPLTGTRSENLDGGER